MAYENDAIGDIIIMKNMVFQNTKTGKNEIDHSWVTGRPCLIIYSDDEYDYFLTFTSTIRGKKFDKQYFPINSNDLLYQCQYRMDDKRRESKKRKSPLEGRINLENVYKKRISGNDVIYKIKLDTLKEVIEALKKYYNGKSIEEIISTSKKVGGR